MADPSACSPAAESAVSLKSIRLSLQEVLEDDATKRGSASRMGMLLGVLTLCVGFLAALVIHMCGIRDMSDVLSSLIVAIAGGGAGPYTFKRLLEVWKGHGALPSSGVPSTPSPSDVQESQ
jgi:hypothetical protein